MKTSKCNLWIAGGIALVAIILALPGRLHGQTAASKSSGGNGTSATRWSVQVDQVDPGNLDLASSFQIAIYENLVVELNKTKQFQQVFRDGDLKAGEVPNHEVNSTQSTSHARGKGRSAARREWRRSLLRQQPAGYSQPGSQHRENDQAIILVRFRATNCDTHRPTLSQEET